MSVVNILVVEDEAIIGETIRRSLVRLGYAVTGIAVSATDAMQQAKDTPPDVVLMDINIKGRTDGIEAAIAMNRAFNLPVIFLTSHSDPGTLSRAKTALPYGYLIKPFEDQGLRATIEMALYRAEVERKNHRMERWLTATLHTIGDGVFAVDAEGVVTFVNAEAERLTGYLRHEAIGRDHGAVLRFVDEETQRPVASPVQQALDSGLVIQLDSKTALITRGKQLLPVDHSAAPTRDSEGRVTGVVLVVRDRSERKRSEEERRRIEQKMQEAQRLESIGVLAGGIAHDFKNLLTIIVGNVSHVSGTTKIGDAARQCLDESVEAAMRAADLCEQLLNYAGKNKNLLRSLDLTAEVESTLALFKLSVPKYAQFTVNCARGLPFIRADISQLRQVIMNLVMNAAEALGNEPGEISFTTGLLHAGAEDFAGAVVGADLPAGDYVFLKVSDTGCGMAPEIQERIFDPFFTTKFLGRGLGLAAVLGIVRNHGGALFLSSMPDAGTTFRVLFPAEPRQAATEGSEGATEDESGK